MYDEPPSTFDALLAPFPTKVQEVARWLRDLVMGEFPQVEENIYGGLKSGNALYSIGSPDRVALGIQPGPESVKLYLHDPEHLGKTSFKLEGKGKHMRHIKFASVPAERREELVELARIPVERRS